MDRDEWRMAMKAEFLANRRDREDVGEATREAGKRGKRAREGKEKKLRRTGQRPITDFMDRNVLSAADAHKRARIQRTKDRVSGWELLEKDKKDKLAMPPPDPRPPQQWYADRQARIAAKRAATRAAWKAHTAPQLSPTPPEEEEEEEEDDRVLTLSQYQRHIREARRTGRY